MQMTRKGIKSQTSSKSDRAAYLSVLPMNSPLFFIHFYKLADSQKRHKILDKFASDFLPRSYLPLSAKKSF